MARLLFYVSGHGYGHATRVAALLAALREQDPELELHVRSEAPGWIFRERAPDATLHEAAADVGILQPNGLDLDLPATLAAHEDFVGGWDARLGREVAFLGEIAPDLVVADIPPLAFDAAQRAGVDAVGIANFSWD